MNAQKLLNEYSASLQTDSEIDLRLCVLDILKYLSNREKGEIEGQNLKQLFEEKCSICGKYFGIDEKTKNYFECNLPETKISYKICLNCFDDAFHIAKG